MDYSRYVKNACRKTGLFGHQKNSWDDELSYPENDKYKMHNHSSRGCRYNHMYDVSNEVFSRINQIHRSPINVSIFCGMDPVCAKHRRVMNWRPDDSDGAEFYCPECEHERKFMNSHPKQVSKEECILMDIYHLNRIMFSGLGFGRIDYAEGLVFSKDVEKQVGFQLKKGSFKRFL